MWGKQLRIAALGALFAIVLTAYQNCSPKHSGPFLTSSASVGLNKACQEILKNAWLAGYRPFTQQTTACVGCHTSGPGSGFFASADADIGFAAFMAKGEAKVSEFAVNPSHKPPNTGPVHQTQITALKASWATAQGSYNACLSNAGGGGGGTPGGGGGGGVIQPTKMTLAKTANPANNAVVTLTYNLGTEMMNAADAFAGGSLVVSVRAVTIAGNVTGYQFENLRLINASPTSAFISSLNLYVNDQLVDGESYLYIERYVPNVANNNSRRLIPGAVFLASPIGTAINVKFAIGQVKAADIDFRPTTYTALTAAGGTFQASCVGCHGASGGFSLAANNFANVVGRKGVSNLTLAAPYNLGDSLIYQRMSSAGAPMPTGGLLPKEQVDRVRDWILDGAPLNDAAIAR